jgi:hypothetical protein
MNERGFFMEEVLDRLEYAARFALKCSESDLPIAIDIAAAKYAAMVKRNAYAEELREISNFIHDFGSQMLEPRGIPSVVGLG